MNPASLPDATGSDEISFDGARVVLGDGDLELSRVVGRVAALVAGAAKASDVIPETLAKTNLAAALLRVALKNQLPDLIWRSGRVEFAADGTVGYHP